MSTHEQFEEAETHKLTVSQTWYLEERDQLGKQDKHEELENTRTGEQPSMIAGQTGTTWKIGTQKNRNWESAKHDSWKT